MACENAEAILIDNKQANLDAWATRGGPGYLYTSDDAFVRDVAEGVDALLDCARLDRDDQAPLRRPKQDR